MNPHLCFLRAAFAAATLFGPVALASDHADPMSVTNPFKPQDDPVANITDLHAFVVNKSGALITNEAAITEADQLIISLCVRRRLLPWQIGGLSNDVPKYSFKVHLDLNPDVRFFDAVRTRDGRDYQATIDDLNRRIEAATTNRNTARDAARQERPMSPEGPAVAAVRDAQAKLDTLRTNRATLVEQHQRDASVQALYGGDLFNPTSIAEEAILDFHLEFAPDGENSDVWLDQTQTRIDGIPGEINVVSRGRRTADGMKELTKPSHWKTNAINIECGIFDDPFIFPRFFRGNVVGIVTSIPLRSLHRPGGAPAVQGPILLWATTHRPDGKQSDHVGRSLRTQLPRFGYLNGVHPSVHVAEIQRVHEAPDLLENLLATAIAPLEAHRHYDSMPDVMIYDLRKPARFPNGRWLEDDVARILADAGETLLVELAYAESKQFPRATSNDKPFSLAFPYLAPRWTAAETSEHALPGATMGNFKVPDAPDSAAIALPDLHLKVWRSLWFGLAIGLILTGGLAWWALRGLGRRLLMLLLVLIGFCLIQPLLAPALMPMDQGFMQQPQKRLFRGIAGGGLIGVLGLIALYGFGIRRGRIAAARDALVPPGEQGLTTADRQYSGSTFREVRDAVFDNPYYVQPWGTPGQPGLPVYATSAATVARGLFSRFRSFQLQDAAARTLVSQADLRWGRDKKGTPRLIHPNGVCLTGRWEITEDTDYSGYFARGSCGLVIARYSSGLGVRRGEARTLSMVGKLYPTLNPNEKHIPASFITQEDLGAAYSSTIHRAILRNAPDVTLLRRRVGLGTFVLVLLALLRVDRQVNVRQLYQIAELGKPKRTRCPQFMQLRISSPRVGGGDDTADFRDDVLTQIYDRGSRVPREQKLVFEIFVSDSGRITGLLNKRLEKANWKRIGTITFDEAVASHVGDFVLHFHHPRWRDDPNDPKTEAGPSGLGKALDWIIKTITRLNRLIG